MSELASENLHRISTNKSFLATSSLLVLSILLSEPAHSEPSSGPPTFWIELGGQLERRDGGDARFLTVFEPALENSGLLTPTSTQQAPRYSYGGELKLSAQPQGSVWSFDASVRYGRSNGSKHRYEQIPSPQPSQGGGYYPSKRLLTSDAQAKFSESHAILDFDAQRDVGLGLSHSDMKIGFGIRMAQFSSRESMKAYALPELAITKPVFPPLPHLHYTRYVATGEIAQRFRGVGPSIAISGTAPIAGRSDGSRLLFDWGINASVLFGRQKANGFQKTHEKIVTFLPIPGKYTTNQTTASIDRARSIVVPNVGGTAALTLDFSNAKLTLGYRADFFFGAVDGGIDTRRTYDRNFYGPFATISVGLGG